jgi:DUF4097 and DUF4098 domain-containing protein YvlB
MLSEGKITVEEAEKLLQAVGGTSAEGERGERRKPKDLGDLFEEIGQEVRRAVGSVQASQVGQVVRQEVDRAFEKVQRMEVGSMVNEVMAQVKDAVAEALEHSGRKEVSEEMDWTLDGTGLARLEATTDNGNVRFAGGEGSEVRIRAHKRVKARTQEEAEEFARQVEVQAVREGDVVRVYKEHPKPPQGVQVEVGYRIEGPRLIDLELRTVNGNVEARGSEGSAYLHSTNGNLTLEGGRGQVQLRTQNGNVRATVAELRQEGLFTVTNGNATVTIASGQAPLTATSTNGNIKVCLPEEFAGRLDAQTTNGQVRSEVELTQVEKAKRTHLAGQIGAGGQTQVRLHALNGNVVLKKADAGEGAPMPSESRLEGTVPPESQ